ncbi:MAG: RNA polymerase sigma factor [Chloroflexi bacterium]|nr:RNA polymerase sigma factor [Chloroflexota bacterium]
MKAQSNNPPGDETRLAREARTNADAFAELYRRYVNNVFRYHMAHTGNVKDAEDLTSQTFMAALENIRSYRERGSFIAWLMGIASRKRPLFFRGLRREVPLDAALHIPDPEPAPDQTAFHHLQIESVSRALKQLSPDRAEAIILYFFGGLTHSEAARVLGKSEAAVKMLISRGLQDLRERTSLALEVER